MLTLAARTIDRAIRQQRMHFCSSSSGESTARLINFLPDDFDSTASEWGGTLGISSLRRTVRQIFIRSFLVIIECIRPPYTNAATSVLFGADGSPHKGHRGGGVKALKVHASESLRWYEA